MSLIAIEMDVDRFLVASARLSRTKFQIEHVFSVPFGESSDNEAGETLKAALAENGLSRSEAIVVVSRSSVEMRELEVPPAPDEELPDMVRFLARNEFASLNDQWLLDFVPLGKDPSVPRNVLATGISPEFNRQINKIADVAGLRIKHIVLRPFASIDLLQAKLDDNKRRLIVNRNGDQTDMTIVAGHEPLATRSVRIPTNVDVDQRTKSMAGEIQRTLASFRQALGSKPVDEVILYSTDTDDGSLEAMLTERIDADIEFVPPFSLAKVSSNVSSTLDQSRYAALLGSLAQEHLKQPPQIDFVNPRRPLVKTADRSRLYLYGGLAVVATLLAILVGWWTLRTQAAEIAALKSDLADAKRVNDGNANLPSVEQIMGEVTKIDQWKLSDVSWLEELYQTSDKSLTPDDAIVDSFDAGLRRGEPRIVVRSRVAGVQTEEALIDALDSRPFQVTPTKSGESDIDPSYPMSFDFSMLLNVEREQTLQQINEKTAEFLQQQNAKQPTVDESAPE